MTIKQRMFIRSYMKTLNATEAAYSVYNTTSRASAATIGWNLLRNIEIQKEINRVLESGGLSLESITKNLSKIANGTPDKVTGTDKLNAIRLLLKLQGVQI